MDDNEIQDVINTVGMLSEIFGLFRDALDRNGFDQDEILYLAGIYLEILCDSK